MRVPLFEFEAAEDAPVEASAPAPAAEPAAPAEPVSEGDGGPDEGGDEGYDVQQLVADELDARLAAQSYQQQQFPPQQFDQYGQPPPFDPSQLDPYAEDYGQNLMAGIQYTVQQALQGQLGPITSALEQAQQADQAKQWEQAKKDLVADEISRGSELTEAGGVLAESLVDSFLPEAMQRYGPSNRATELATAQAVEFARELEAQAEQRGVEKYKNQLETLSGAPPAEPGMSAGSVVPGQPARAQSVEEIVRKYAVN